MKNQNIYFVILLFIGLCLSVRQATSCTERGRFPDDESYDCRGYVMCLAGGITNFTQYKLNCPQGFIYSHIEQQCTNATNYNCHPTFNCTSTGTFVNPESEDCSSYISCLQGFNGIAAARLVECPLNTVFNTTTEDCTDNNLTTCQRLLTTPNSNSSSISVTHSKLHIFIFTILCAMMYK